MEIIRIIAFAFAVLQVAVAQLQSCNDLREGYKADLFLAREFSLGRQRHLFKPEGGVPIDVPLGGNVSSVCDERCREEDGSEQIFHSCCRVAAEQFIVGPSPPTAEDGPVLSRQDFLALCIPAALMTSPPPTTEVQATTAPPTSQTTGSALFTSRTEPSTEDLTSQTTPTAAPTSASPESCPRLTLSQQRFTVQSRSKVCLRTCTFATSVYGHRQLRHRTYYTCCDGAEPKIVSRALRLYTC